MKTRRLGGVITLAAAGPTLTVGTTLSALPAGCSQANAGGVTYHVCGSAWLRPYMQGSSVSYVVVPPP
jgi:hypothetical protein